MLSELYQFNFLLVFNSAAGISKGNVLAINDKNQYLLCCVSVL